MISDTARYLYIEILMRGGISYISGRDSKINEDNKFVMYWDANNLYTWAMNQPLPYCDNKFVIFWYSIFI